MSRKIVTIWEKMLNMEGVGVVLRRLLLLFVGIILLLCVSVPATLGKSLKKLAEEYLKRADDLSNIQAKGSSPFRLDARVRLFADDTVAEGRYSSKWRSPDQWRDELTFPDYHQIRVGTKGAVWRSKDHAHQPLSAVQFLEGLFVPEPLDTFENMRFRALPPGPDGRHLNCVLYDLTNQLKGLREKCFDPVSGLLFTETWHDWDTVWEYTDYALWNGKIYPRLMRIFQNNKLVSETRITTLEKVSDLETQDLIPLKDAEEWPQCENVRAPRRRSQDESILDALVSRYHAPMSFFLEMGSDGHVSDVSITYPAIGPQTQLNLLIKLKQIWVFKPAKCGKIPIPTSMTLEIPPWWGAY
jgi:hypothetical protein